MKTLVKTISLKMIIVFSVAAVMLATAAQANTVVSPGNMDVWGTQTLDADYNPIITSNVGVAFVSGPSTPPLGSGSANLWALSDNGDGFPQLFTGAYAGTKLSALTSLQYETYCTQNNGQQFPYLVLCVDNTGVSGATNDKLFFEPPYQTPASGNSALPNQGQTSMNTWQGWNAQAGGWWDNDGLVGMAPGNGGTGNQVQSLATYIATYPNAVISSEADSVAFRVGQGSPTDSFDGYVDAFTIGTAGGTTTYDFEPVPEPGTLTLFALAGLCGLAMAWIRRRKSSG